MTGLEFYILILVVYFGTDLIATWGLNLQFGVTGVLNLSYIVDVAVGAYVYGVLTLGPWATSFGGFQKYVLGLGLPPAVGLAGAMVAGGIVGGLIAFIGNKRLRPDYHAVALLVVSVVALTVVEADTGLFNGNPGITLIPNPLGGTGAAGNGWGYAFLVAALALLTYVVIHRLADGPLGRTLRAVRDDERLAASLGKDVVRMKIMVQVVGGALGALSGALLAGFIGAWSPSAWAYIETMALLIAIIVGGSGNNWGVLLGTLLVPVIIQQATQFIPDIPNHPGLVADFSWMILGLLAIAFIWLRPQGLLRERRPRHTKATVPLPAEAKAAAPPAPRGTAGEPVLEVRDVVVRFGGVTAVDGASWAARRGDVTGLIGPNGAGKTTLINVVSGFVKPTSGRVLFEGRDLTGASPERMARAGLIRTFQLPRAFSRLTVIEILLVAAPHQRGEGVRGAVFGPAHWRTDEAGHQAKAWEILELFEMTAAANDPAANLSGGQKRMLELMRSLMTEPSLLLLDEPLAGLSGRWASILEEAVLKLKAQGLSLVLVEHELGIVERLCDDVIVMAQGRVLSTGTMADLRTRAEVQAAYVIG